LKVHYSWLHSRKHADRELVGLRSNCREVLITDAMDAEPRAACPRRGATAEDRIRSQRAYLVGKVGFMVIEGSMFVMGLIVYFYLRLKVDPWPPSLANPQIGFATANLCVVLASLLPNAFAKRAAEALDLRGVRLWLLILTLVGVVVLVLRAFE
jgi:heme/copper-type cytochrome/quinol oxidase subunit 3